MNSLTQLSDIFAGVRTINIVPASDVYAFGDIISGVLQNIVLQPGITLSEMEYTVGSAEIKIETKNAKTVFNQTQIQVFLPGNTADQVLALNELEAKKAILIVTDRNGFVWVVGSPDNPLRVTDNYSTGKAMSENSGRKIVFENTSRINLLSFDTTNISNYEPPTPVLDEFYFNTNLSSINIKVMGTDGQVITFENEDGDVRAVTGINLTYVYATIPAPGSGKIRCISGAEYIIRLDISSKSITAVGNLDKVLNIEYLYCSSNIITTIDLSACSKLKFLTLSTPYYTITSITWPETNVLEYVNILQHRLSSIDFTDFYDNCKSMIISANVSTFTVNSWDLSAFKKIQSIYVQGLPLTQANVDSLFIGFLSSWETYTRTKDPSYDDVINATDCAVPSATGLAAISSLQAYGFECTYET